MIDRIALILVIIGALNWGSIGIFGFDIVGWLLEDRATLSAALSLPSSASPEYGASPFYSEKMIW